MSDPNLGIGRELSYLDTPARTVVIHFADDASSPFRSAIAERVLDIADAWFLFPRYDALPSLELIEVNAESTAIEFGRDARRSLAEYLATRPMQFGIPGLDLYAVASEGQALITWDHHTQDEGLSVQLQRVNDATKLAASLCSFGSEFEVLSKVWGEGGA
jgi:hypothetical protein